MSQGFRRAAVLLTAGMGLLAAALAQTPPVPAPRRNAGKILESQLKSWPELQRNLAAEIAEQYGDPNEVRADRVIWYNNTPWKRTVVYKEPWVDKYGNPHLEYLQQVISYAVPLDKVADLARFDTRVVAERSKTELSSRTNSERANFLALNLADDIVIRWRTPAEARAFARRVEQLTEAGKASGYTKGFLFAVDNERDEVPY